MSDSNTITIVKIDESILDFYKSESYQMAMNLLHSKNRYMTVNCEDCKIEDTTDTTDDINVE